MPTQRKTVYWLSFFVLSKDDGQETGDGEPGLDRRRVPPRLFNLLGSPADLSVGVKTERILCCSFFIFSVPFEVF